MQTPKIKTFNMNAPYGSHYFFLLSKGYNAGKPLDKPCPNCFAVMTESELEKQKLFWIAYSVWKSGRYIPLLVGSVIPFLHIRDTKHVLIQGIEKMDSKPEEFAKLVDQLQSLYKLEKQLELQQKIIGRIKISLVRSFYK